MTHFPHLAFSLSVFLKRNFLRLNVGTVCSVFAEHQPSSQFNLDKFKVLRAQPNPNLSNHEHCTTWCRSCAARSLPANDPFGGQYASALASYNANPDNAAILAPRVVSVEVESARGGARKVPTAFLLQHHPDGKLHVYLQLAKYVPSFGLPATQWDNLMFAQKGELILNQSVQVNWDDAYFTHATAVRVLEPANLSTQLTAADPADRFLAPTETKTLARKSFRDE